MEYRLPKIIKKSFEDYSSEAESELEELSKLKVIAFNGSTTKKEITISIDSSEAIEVRVYNLSNFSNFVYSDFNKRIRKLIK